MNVSLLLLLHKFPAHSVGVLINHQSGQLFIHYQVNKHKVGIYTGLLFSLRRTAETRQQRRNAVKMF